MSAWLPPLPSGRRGNAFGRRRKGGAMDADEKKKIVEHIGECAREYDMKYAG